MGKSTTKRVGSHYVLDDVLGRGSMGTVWRGHDLNDGSPCAIKILNPTLTTDKGATRRFIDERDIFMSVDDDAVVRDGDGARRGARAEQLDASEDRKSVV